MEKANKYRRMRIEAGRLGGTGEMVGGVECEKGEEWGCRALFIRTATLGPQALLDHSQNHTAANAEDQLPLSPSVVLWPWALLSSFPVSSSLNLSTLRWIME